MKKPGYVSLDKSGTNKESGAKDAMPGFENFSAYGAPDEIAGYEQDLPPPANLQDNPDVKKSSPSISTPDRYY